MKSIILFLLPILLFSKESVQTDEDHRRMGFFSALYDMAEAKKKPLNAIPPVLHFIWLGPKPFPPTSIAAVKSWIDRHPGWSYQFWSDQKRQAPDERMKVRGFEDFPLESLKDCYFSSDNFGERARLLSYAVLLSEGGVYVDHDVECLKAIDPLQQSHDFFCGLEPLGPSVLSSSVNPSPHLIGAAAKHPILIAAKGWLLREWERLEQQYPGIDPDSVYNRVMHRAFRSLYVGIKEAHSKDQRKDVVLPSEKEAVFAVHRHLGTWHQKESESDIKVKSLFSKIGNELNRNFFLALTLTIANVCLFLFLLWKMFQRRNV